MNDYAPGGGPEHDTETGGDPYADMRAAKPWLEMIADAEKCFATWQDKCDNIDKLYADLKGLSGANAERQMQIFWANLEVLKPSIYARPPVPVVGPRFKDRKPVLRHASELLERCLMTSFDVEDINQTMLALRDDVALCARGVVWLRLEEDEQGVQKVCYDHIDRRDFVHEPSRKWKEVSWLAKRVYKTMEEMRARFEEISGDAYMKAVYDRRKDEGEEYEGEKKACVWELWHKKKGVVVWVADGPDDVLDIRAPFLSLEGFFPCPRPAYGTLERRTLKPVPDFVYYKDQVEEINELTARISALAEALRMKGFYAGGNEDVAGAIETAIKSLDNNAILIPVSNFAALGGASLRDSIVWMPVRDVAEVIVQCIQLRKQLIEDVYQITGLSDIMRGATDPNETLGAQQLKSQYGSVRIRDKQSELVRIARDMTRIAGEIMAENFSPDTLLTMSQYEEVPTRQQVEQQIMQVKGRVAQAAANPEMVRQAQANPEQAQKLLEQTAQETQRLQQQVTLEQVIEFLQSQKMRPFALDIETDSTIQPDEDAAKQRTTEMLAALSNALGQLGPMVAAQPKSAEFAAEVLKFAVAPFRAGRALEAAIEAFAEDMKVLAGQERPPDPASVKAEADAKAMQAELQMKQMDMQMRMQETQVKASTDMEQARADIQKTMAEIEKIAAEVERIRAQTSGVIAGAHAKQAERVQ